jgi:hypothetical protein
MNAPVEKNSRARKLDLIFGVVVPGIILGPMLLLGLLGMAVTGASGPVPDESKGVMQSLIAMSIAGLFGIAAVAAAVLMGPERIKQRPIFRFSVVLALVAGIAVAAFALWSQRSSVAWSASASENFGALFLIVPGLLALGGPIVVALRRLPSLLAK